MDNVAVISDIHGNIPALEAVLADIKNRKIELIVCLGDIIGKGPGSSEAVDIISKECNVVIRGNWDDYIAHHDEGGSIGWYRRQLGRERLNYLRNLPLSHEFFLSGRLVSLFHAHPQNVYKRVFPHHPLEDRLGMFQHSLEYDTAVGKVDIAGYGDIHGTYLQNIRGKLLFNTGSVGNPLDFTMASYAILKGDYQQREEGNFSLEFVRVEYDIELAVSQAKEIDLPEREAYINELRTGIYRGRKDK
ncbi:MAG: metallophosphoesterase family protein [Halanaerobium sp.]|nr:metallophosphoesterase family protein [Halanaerobium sp.]